jgi:predicted  nucleic acid-binding Zn-ribbon protein
VAFPADFLRGPDLAKVYCVRFNRMNVPFKTLAEARSAFDALETETIELRARMAVIPDLEAQLAECRGWQATAIIEEERFKALIGQKDAEISELKSSIDASAATNLALKNQISELEKGQKTAKQHARELVAATGGAPVNVDQSEIQKMQAGSEEEYKKLMLAEHDPKRLAQLYQEYNQLFRNKSKKR